MRVFTQTVFNAHFPAKPHERFSFGGAVWNATTTTTTSKKHDSSAPNEMNTFEDCVLLSQAARQSSSSSISNRALQTTAAVAEQLPKNSWHIVHTNEVVRRLCELADNCGNSMYAGIDGVRLFLCLQMHCQKPSACATRFTNNFHPTHSLVFSIAARLEPLNENIFKIFALYSLLSCCLVAMTATTTIPRVSYHTKYQSPLCRRRVCAATQIELYIPKASQEDMCTRWVGRSANASLMPVCCVFPL